MRFRRLLAIPVLASLFCLPPVYSQRARRPPTAEVDNASKNDEQAVSQSLKTFTQMYSVVEQNFADPVKSETAFYQGAIPGMLNTLDPHSHFFIPKSLRPCRRTTARPISGSA